jgi:hypothetical protein
MMHDTSSSGDGWTFAKGLAMALAVLGMAGFGLCALCGVALSIEDLASANHAEIWPIALLLSAFGAAVTLALFLVARSIVRSARRDPPPGP